MGFCGSKSGEAIRVDGNQKSGEKSPVEVKVVEMPIISDGYPGSDRSPGILNIQTVEIETGKTGKPNRNDAGSLKKKNNCYLYL